MNTSGEELHSLCTELYPICRSITGNGVRQTLQSLQSIIPLQIHEIPTGTGVFDWEVPFEWNLKEAYIEDEQGRRIVDTADHNLHVMSYSQPTELFCSLEELDKHLHSLPERPDLIPYRTGYYADTWGFCLTHQQRELLQNQTYKVKIDATFEPGSLTYGEFFLPGSSDREILISTHLCHPSLVNDNLSGLSVTAHIAKYFMNKPLRYGLRFIFIPATIGAISWLATNEHKIPRIDDGLVISGIGDPGAFTYKKSRNRKGLLDRVFGRRFAESDNSIREFTPYGYDERQYCSPGIDIDMGCLMRTPFGEYPEYHTSADNLSFVRPAALEEAMELCIDVLSEAQAETYYLNTSPKCEPQLGKRGLYEPIGGASETKQVQLAQFWLLNYSDGLHSFLEILELSELDFDTVQTAARRLVNVGLLEELPRKPQLEFGAEKNAV